MTHRAVMGISMGGGGTASFGLRHHDLFDVLAPLGGPVDWTWMLDYITSNHLGGFRPIPSGTTLNRHPAHLDALRDGRRLRSPTRPAWACSEPRQRASACCFPPVSDPYAHPQTFNTWWYEYPNAGNGGTFTRATYAQFFRDLSLMFGNPNGDNLSPGAENLPAGVPPTDPSVVGNHPGNECAVTVDPICPVGAGRHGPRHLPRSSPRCRSSGTTARPSAASTRSPCRTTSTASTTPTASSR